MMDVHGQKAMVLFEQGRYAQASDAFRAALAEDPNDPHAHAFLALTYSILRKDGPAMEAARQAVALEPDNPFTHYCLAQVHFNFDRHVKALEAGNEAVRLDPQGEDYHALVARTHLVRDRWNDALAATDRALACDPQHVDSLNLRTLTLAFLGRNDEARATSLRALALAPESDETQAAAGRARLHAGDSEGALIHFREALRLDPTSEPARTGFLEAIKSRHRVYRWMLKFLLWMGRQSTTIRWCVVIALILGRRALHALSREYPPLAPIAIPLGILLALFLLLTWVADPLFNLLIRFDPVGRHALTPRQRAGSNYLVAFLGTCLVIGAAAAMGARGAVLGIVAMVALIALPATLLFSYPTGPQRRRLTIYLACVSVMGASALALYILSLEAVVAVTALLFLAFAYGAGCLLSISIRAKDEREGA